ncbi:hypothetical protein C8R44DRAFT_814312 [Mycena epipterygia]|nr:hypothetical protein C8R44DRAFT_814312 [Mycena epipterygia]
MLDNIYYRGSLGVPSADRQLREPHDFCGVELRGSLRQRKTNRLADAKIKKAPIPHEATMRSGTNALNVDESASIPDLL